MTDLAEPVRPVRITDETTADEIAVTLELLNEGAKRISRCGKIAMLRPEYAAQHARLNAVLDDYCDACARA